MWLISVPSPAAAAPKNLLPNASFELAFGYGVPDNWFDMYNPLTMKLAATDQIPQSVPEDWWKGIEGAADAPDGPKVVRVPIPEGQPGHLISPMVPLKMGQVYTLSAYARSDAPSAKLALTVWMRPLDWTVAPDVQSEPLPLTVEWQRLQVTFIVASFYHQGVVDLVPTADTAGNIWVDAVQLEKGPQATAFETRYPVEALLTGVSKPFTRGYLMGMLQLMGEPLEINVATYATDRQGHPENLKLSIETLDGKVVHTSDIPAPGGPGVSSAQLSVDFPLVGKYRARVVSSAGEDVSISSYGYMFYVNPVMDENFQGILYSREGRVHKLPAERITLPWQSPKNQLWGPASKLTVTNDGLIYVYPSGGAPSKTLRTRDGGWTWDSLPGAVTAVLGDGTLLSSGFRDNQVLFFVSSDEGKTWEARGTIPGFEVAPILNAVTSLHDGTLVWPLGYKKPGENICTLHVHRSTDGGRTWSEGYPACPGSECSLLELKSGRLLAVCRINIHPPIDAWSLYLENEVWRMFMRSNRHPGIMGISHPEAFDSLHKCLLLADSDDGGRTWKNVRFGTTDPGTMHGSAVQLPDGRIVLIHVHRWPYIYGGEWAKVSRDGANTWEEETYYLSTVPGKPGYSTSCVLPPELADGKPGMILTVLGERNAYLLPPGFEDRPAQLQAVRWRPLP